MTSEAVTSPPGESISSTTARTLSSSRACCKAARISSTIESPTLPGSDELMRPRKVMTAILSLLPRCTITSRKRGVASSWREPPLKRLMAMTTRIKFTITLAQSATNKKMLRQPSFLLAAMTGQTCGERTGTQGNSPRSCSILYSPSAILAASNPQWRATCFLGDHEQHRSSPTKRENAPGGKNESAPWPSPESRSGKRRARAGCRRHADADEESPPCGSPRLGAEAPDYRLGSQAAVKSVSSRAAQTARDLTAVAPICLHQRTAVRTTDLIFAQALNPFDCEVPRRASPASG